MKMSFRILEKILVFCLLGLGNELGPDLAI